MRLRDKKDILELINTIEEGILYATSYFRALEVANFFKINAQEIKLNLLKIIEKFNSLVKAILR